jgi:hypothetical protein
MTTISKHAREQIALRRSGDVLRWPTMEVLEHREDVFDQQAVFQAVAEKRGQISAAKAEEVRVIVCQLDVIIHAPDGSNGDLVIACVDRRSLTVKTVMLQRSTQVRRSDKVYV